MLKNFKGGFNMLRRKKLSEFHDTLRKQIDFGRMYPGSGMIQETIMI